VLSALFHFHCTVVASGRECPAHSPHLPAGPPHEANALAPGWLKEEGVSYPHLQLYAVGAFLTVHL